MRQGKGPPSDRNSDRDMHTAPSRAHASTHWTTQTLEPCSSHVSDFELVCSLPDTASLRQFLDPIITAHMAGSCICADTAHHGTWRVPDAQDSWWPEERNPRKKSHRPGLGFFWFPFHRVHPWARSDQDEVRRHGSVLRCQSWL
jgi:hypothetical protein